MSMTKGLTRLRSAVIALGLVAGVGTGAAEGAAILKYQTATAIDLSKGISGPNLISFTPATAAGVDLASGSVNAGLGTFVVAPPAAGASTTYDNVKFAITFLPQDLNGNPIASLSTVITGVLNGVIDSPYHSTVTATFDAPDGSLDLGTQKITLSFPKGDKLLVPSQSNSGLTTAEALITSTPGSEAPVPEPSTIALVLTTLGGLGLRQYVSGRRVKQA
ncbi:PEP-CTERM sorting domain-containing protein [Paludisphaera mucosa]|uniref:PEP-CTERM sorting domain-containing protein n=1 Tax=Paludisphaera mucosa TaxID=3030827 RepID=A0ABT6F4P0_9BACT|nr:PEP-CTERM sorting domain-containing protein [Paludisphaera mucosa]MDG3002540.1 PEP-CTERM sorting domain-containing protein [Paludisphaera mucosa]